MTKNLLPKMCEVSRNCGHTQHLYSIFQSKLSETDFYTLEAWLRIVREEREIAVNQSKKIFGT